MIFSDNILDIADATESVVLHVFGSDRYVEIDKALCRRTLEQDKQWRNDLTPYQWQTWCLPQTDSAELLVPGNEILDKNAKRWIVTKTERSQIPGTFRCVAFCLDAAFKLDEYVDLFRRNVRKTSSGTVEHDWSLVRAGIPAKFSDINKSGDATESKMIVISLPVDVGVSDRLRLIDGSYWRVDKIVTPYDSRHWTELYIRKTQD